MATSNPAFAIALVVLTTALTTLALAVVIALALVHVTLLTTIGCLLLVRPIRVCEASALHDLDIGPLCQGEPHRVVGFNR
jgi:hypothetical protein